MSVYDGKSRYREPAATLELGYADDMPIDPDPLNPHPEHPTPIELVVRPRQHRHRPGSHPRVRPRPSARVGCTAARGAPEAGRGLLRPGPRRRHGQVQEDWRACPRLARRFPRSCRAYYDEPDEIVRIDGLCGPNCGPDPLLDQMDPLFDLESEWEVA